jgi:hypothetical protein
MPKANGGRARICSARAKRGGDDQFYFARDPIGVVIERCRSSKGPDPLARPFGVVTVQLHEWSINILAHSS